MLFTIIVISIEKFYVSYPETAVWLVNVEMCVTGYLWCSFFVLVVLLFETYG